MISKIIFSVLFELYLQIYNKSNVYLSYCLKKFFFIGFENRWNVIINKQKDNKWNPVTLKMNRIYTCSLVFKKQLAMYIRKR